ncbi:hypothetical protein [Streptomyces sp. NPDC048340]|uniref:hypothetical protein n=1 Tax=Streptomyces sp. NPDC048340 TaxID=3365537 RepID=UPI00371F56B8
MSAGCGDCVGINGAKSGGRLQEAVSLQAVKRIARGAGWLSPGVGDLLDGGEDPLSIEIDLGQNENEVTGRFPDSSGRGAWGSPLRGGFGDAPKALPAA